jgi:hypothetical protein
MNTEKETIEAEIVQIEERNELTSFLDLSSIKPRVIADNINNQLKEGFLNPLQVKLTLKKLFTLNYCILMCLISFSCLYNF